MPPALRRMFWFLNKFFMVPLFRLGLGFLFGNPFSGYIMVLKVVGRKSGKIYYAPVNYAIHEGNVYCISGGRQSSNWYKNLKVNPRIELILPAGPIFGVVEEVLDAGERRSIIRQVLQNAGFAGFFEGYNPFTISDEALVSKTSDLPLLRIHPLGIGSGASDPRGWAWVWSLMLTLWIVWALVR
ncbi:MAG TPA: nitroreductase family deazaflavin-dependent oxidoreductase [Anaerolineales bacterium]